MAWSQTDLDKLEAAIASGARRVKYSDKEVEYHSIADMSAVRRMIRRELGLESRTQRIYATFSKGTTSSTPEPTDEDF